MSIKTSVNLPDETIDALRELAEKRQTTLTEVLRQAVSTEKFFDTTITRGGKILIEEPDKKQKQVIFKY
jgi:predicted transcriptional regulator